MAGSGRHGVSQGYLMDLVTDYRGVFICIFLLPISVALNIVAWVRLHLSTLRSNAKGHAKRVNEISSAVREASKGGQKLCTDRPGYATMSLKGEAHKKNHTKIPMKDLLVDIIDMDAKSLTVRVEPLVNMGQLSRYLIPRGYTLEVLPELDELTVGGLLMGFGIESSSHIAGLFQEICVEYEVVLGDGQVVRARADNEYADLFYALPWSYGTLGLIVGTTLKVMKCQPFVKVTYKKYSTLASLSAAFEEASCKASPARFVECLAYDLNTAVVMEADFCANKYEKGATFEDIGLWFKKWFYIHVEEVVANAKDGEAVVEIMPLRSYYHRHTKGIFWEMQYIIPFADQAWFRYLLGWAVPPNLSLMKSTQTAAMKKMWREQFVVQDVLVPIRDLKDIMVYLDKRIRIYPMWLCPHLVKRHKLGGMLRPSKKCPASDEQEMYVDVGIYGVPLQQPYNHHDDMRALEKKVRDVDGYQGLYALCYMDKDEFRTMFHHELYDVCRVKYGGINSFPDVYDKAGGSGLRAI